MPSKLLLTEVDELIRIDHSYLDADDKCYFLGEYIARSGYAAGATNDLIHNLKKPMDRRGTAEWKWKERAIKRAASDLKAAVNKKWLDSVVIVPMPPSKTRDDPAYDDRVAQVARQFVAGSGGDVRELLYQTSSIGAFHEQDCRRDVQSLVDCFEIDERLADPIPQHIAILDDVLTTGAHFRAAKLVLQHRFEGVPIRGLFIARRIITDDTDDEL